MPACPECSTVSWARAGATRATVGMESTDNYRKKSQPLDGAVSIRVRGSCNLSWSQNFGWNEGHAATDSPSGLTWCRFPSGHSPWVSRRCGGPHPAPQIAAGTSDTRSAPAVWQGPRGETGQARSEDGQGTKTWGRGKYDATQSHFSC